MPQLSEEVDALPPSNSVRARLVPLREELKRACPEQSLRRDVPILDICDCDCRPYTATQHRRSCMPFHRGTIDQSGFRKPSDCCLSENNTSSSSVLICNPEEPPVSRAIFRATFKTTSSSMYSRKIRLPSAKKHWDSIPR